MKFALKMCCMFLIKLEHFDILECFSNTLIVGQIKKI